MRTQQISDNDLGGATVVTRSITQSDRSDPYTEFLAYPAFTREPGRDASWALTRVGAWLGVGFVGASMLLIGVLHLVRGEATPKSALALAVIGGVTAFFGWRSSYLAVESIATPLADAAPAATHATQGNDAHDYDARGYDVRGYDAIGAGVLIAGALAPRHTA